MSSLHTLKTHLLLSLGGIDEHEVEAHVSYWFTPAWPQSHDDPGSDATVEIDNIQLKHGREYHALPGWLVDAFRNDETLIADCFADVVDMAAEAAEYRAEQRRDDLLMERNR